MAYTHEKARGKFRTRSREHRLNEQSMSEYPNIGYEHCVDASVFASYVAGYNSNTCARTTRRFAGVSVSACISDASTARRFETRLRLPKDVTREDC